MKKIILLATLTGLLFFPSLSHAVTPATRISDREIVERLARMEEGQKATNDAIKQLREDINSRFSDINTQLTRMSAIFTALVISIIGFAIWDRRTMVRPFENKVKKIEDDIAENRSKLHALLESLKALSKTDEKVAEVLKRFNLL